MKPINFITKLYAVLSYKTYTRMLIEYHIEIWKDGKKYKYLFSNSSVAINHLF